MRQKLNGSRQRIMGSLSTENNQHATLLTFALASLLSVSSFVCPLMCCTHRNQAPEFSKCEDQNKGLGERGRRGWPCRDQLGRSEIFVLNSKPDEKLWVGPGSPAQEERLSMGERGWGEHPTSCITWEESGAIWLCFKITLLPYKGCVWGAQSVLGGSWWGPGRRPAEKGGSQGAAVGSESSYEIQGKANKK